MEKLRVLCAIAGIVILDCVALFNGIDGVLFLTAIAVISGLGGVPIIQLLRNKGLPVL